MSIWKDSLREDFAESKRQPQSWSYGGYARRRREGAILQQYALRTKLRKARITHILSDRTMLRVHLRPRTMGDLCEIHRKPPRRVLTVCPPTHFRGHRQHSPPHDGFVTVARGAGALLGDSVAGEMFSSTYVPHNSDCISEMADERLMVTCPPSLELESTLP